MNSLPFMPSNIPKKQKTISSFAGINLNISKNNNELSESTNMSSKDYPCLSVREKRCKKTDTKTDITYISSKNEIFYTGYKENNPDVHSITYGEKTVELPESEEHKGKERICAHLSDSLLVMPDKIVYTPSENKAEKIPYTKYQDDKTAFKKAEEDCKSNMMINFPTYIGSLTSTGIVSNTYTPNDFTSYLMTFENLKAGDMVHISFNLQPNADYYDSKYYSYIAKMKNGVDVKIKSVQTKTHNIASGSITEITGLEFGENVIDREGYTTVVIYSLTIDRKMPDLDFLCALNNRAWGVKDNNIRCSRLGDCGCWDDFSADAFGTLPSACFSTDVDTGGEFTAITPFGGTILAFKENCIHKIYGTEPANFTLSTLDCNGVAKGAHKTIAMINGVLYYMGIDGIYAYDGSRPTLISQKTDIRKASVLGAGTDGTNYYLSAKCDNRFILYVYYPKTNTWHTEEIGENKGQFFFFENKLHTVCKGKIYTISDNAGKEDIKWSFALDFDEDTFGTKGYGRLLVRYNLAKDAHFKVTTVCDGNFQKKSVDIRWNRATEGTSVLNLPIIKCNKLKVIFEGKGDFTLMEICREYFLASEFLNT